MTKRIFRSCFLSALLVLIASFALIMGVLYSYFSDQYQAELKNEAVFISSAVELSGMDYCARVNDGSRTDTRITWIAADGTVLYDNKAEADTMENHAGREEVREALENGEGVSKRYSNTLSRQTIYYAMRLSDGTVLRISGSQMSVWALMGGMLQPILLMLVLAVALSGWLAHRAARRVVQPLSEIDLENPLENNDVYDELAPFLTRISRQNRQIQQQMRLLEERQSELNTITEQMDEGLLILDHHAKVLSINRRAAEIFSVTGDCVGRHIFAVNRSAEVMPVLEHALEGQEAETQLEIGGKTYQFLATPVRVENQPKGVVLLILDITQRHQAEQLRREFSANVSHELKTPLTSISGYAELMQNGMVRQEDMVPFAGKIYQEANRLITLIEDIIQLSRLDESGDSFRFEPVDLLEVAKAVTKRLEPQAKSRQITMTVTGGDVQILGVPQILDEMCYNLCENAVKYNHPGGTVDVSVTRQDGHAVLQVKDNGIGIPKEHQSRVFERFYRVDKSHSKATGGTGLGLSIVKHGAMLHKAELSLESEPGVGTTITVTFPCEEAE